MKRALVQLLLCAFLAGCAQFVPQTIALRSVWPPDVARMVELRHVPFFPQSEYQCGPASLATIMNAAGARVDPNDLVDQVYLPARQGSLQVEMLAAPRRHGLVGWQMPANYDALLREVAAGRPVLVLQDLGIWPFTKWHYAVVVGFDYESGELYLRGCHRLALRRSLAESRAEHHDMRSLAFHSGSNVVCRRRAGKFAESAEEEIGFSTGTKQGKREGIRPTRSSGFPARKPISLTIQSCTALIAGQLNG